jgi:hypothetical protein
MKHTLIVFGVLLLAVMILSCSSEPKRWYKAGGTVGMYERDAADCEDVLIDAPTGGSKVESYTFESCMEQKGWVVLDKSAM